MIVVMILALAGWASHNLTYGEMVNTSLWAFGIFGGVEGIADAAGRLRPTPVVVPQADATTVNVAPAPPALVTSSS